MRLDPVIKAVEVHAGGEPGRVIVGGVTTCPAPPCSRSAITSRSTGTGCDA